MAVDPTGEAALEALDRALDEAGPDTVSAFFCEPISAASLPAYTPPTRFWRASPSAETDTASSVCFDEIVTGVGRTGDWFVGAATACTPDIIATAKGLGAGYAAIGAVLVRDAMSTTRSRLTSHPDGALLGRCAAQLRRRVGRVACASLGGAHRPSARARASPSRGARGRARRTAHRARGARARVLAGHRAHRSSRPTIVPATRARRGGADRRRGLRAGPDHAVDAATRDGYAGDQTLFAPPFVTSDEELAEMVTRLADALGRVSADVEAELGATPSASWRRREEQRERDARHGRTPDPGLDPSARGSDSPGLVAEWLGSHEAHAETFGSTSTTGRSISASSTSSSRSVRSTRPSTTRSRS